jgi:trigger factor
MSTFISFHSSKGFIVKVSVEETGPCRKTIRIEVPAADVSAKYDEILAAFARMAKVPGFRPGRAPKELVARRFAKDITGELRDTLVPDYYHKAIKDNKIHSIAILGIDEPEPPNPLKDFVFSVTMDVPPEFKLPEYKGIPMPP